MAIGWITLLKSVPWTDVISNAPKVADGAKRLWKTVAKKPAAPAFQDSAAQTPISADAHSVTTLAARLAETEARISELHGQMLDSSELIKTLAEQNALLIKSIETNRRRVLWLGAATVILSIIVVTGLLGAATLP